MQLPPDSTPQRDHAARTALRRRGVPAAVALLVAAFLPLGCGTAVPSSLNGGAGFVVGTRGRAPFAGAPLAARFASAYARSAYSPRPPGLPGVTAAVQGALVSAAGRVPPGRRRLRPRLLGLTFTPRGATLEASARIGDGRSPPFTVGFTVRRVGHGWRVVAISLPG